MVRKYKGILVTFESTAEGLGKTTQALMLTEKLSELGVSSIYTRNPHTPQLREILKGTEMNLAPATELLLMNADRAQHVHEVVEPALKAGKVVVCDRFFDSTLAYQGYGDGWSKAKLDFLHSIATDYLVPDLTFVFDGTSFRERDIDDRFERRDDEYFERVRQGMLEIASPHPKGWTHRYRMIDANRSKDEVAEDILNQILIFKNSLESLR